MNKTVKLIEAAPQIETFFKGLFDKTDKRLMSAARHGVSEAINKLIDSTRSNISSSWFNSTSSKKYGVPLIEGARGYMYKGAATGFVHILGDTKHNDGTWRLRFFEGGTKPRKSKNGKTYGSIRPAYFFESVKASSDTIAMSEIETAIQNAIDEINKS